MIEYLSINIKIFPDNSSIIGWFAFSAKSKIDSLLKIKQYFSNSLEDERTTFESGPLHSIYELHVSRELTSIMSYENFPMKPHTYVIILSLLKRNRTI